MVTNNKIKKEKPRRRCYRKDPAIISAIQYCIDWNFSINESLDFISKHIGYSMNEKTFRRIKKDLPTFNTQRLEVISEEVITFIHESLAVLRTAKNELVKIIEDPNTLAALKIQASTAMAKNLTTMAEFHDSTPIITSISKLKEGMENAFQKPAGITEKKLS